MSLTDSEKEKVRQWALRSSASIQQVVPYLPENVSYFRHADARDQDLSEYDFQTVEDLRRLLNERTRIQWSDQLDLALAVAVFKRKPEDAEQGPMTPDDGSEGVLPAFIYNM